MTAVRGGNRRRQPGGLDPDAILVWIFVVLVILGLGAFWVAMVGGSRLTGSKVPTLDPFRLLLEVTTGRIDWPGLVGWVLLILTLTLEVSVVGAVWWLIRKPSGSRVDRAAKLMGKGRDLEPISRKGAQAKAQRFGVDQPGLPIGREVSTGRDLWSSWEDMRITIAGPRTGKTTSLVIPEIVAAPGPAIVTSNKRDVVDHCERIRAKGGKVWVFDPQGVAGVEATWWWNPLSYVTDHVRALQLADHFVAGSRNDQSRGDAFFDGTARDLLAGLLMAAALDNRPITQVYTWLTREHDDEPVAIVRAAGHDLLAHQLGAQYTAPDRQRGGVFGTAQQMASTLVNPRLAEWVTAGPMNRPEFSVDKFLDSDSASTLFALSREGHGNAGPLVTALTVAVVEAAEDLAAASPAGRLATPLAVILDEVANVCRWTQLPDQFSHFGSRGIVMDAVLQSWSQGVNVWGETGMKKLWSAANVRIYAGGAAEVDFLSQLTSLVGEYDELTTSTSSSRSHRTVSHQIHQRKILDVADLASLPKGRAVVLAAGAVPALVELVPWMQREYAQEIEVR